MAISFNNTVYGPGFLGVDNGAPKNSFKVDAASTYSVTVNGTVNAPGDTVTLTYGSDAPAGYAGTQVTLTATQYDNSTMILFSGPDQPPGSDPSTSGYRYLLSNTQVFGSGDPNRTTFTADPNDSTLKDYQPAAVCFASGTRIRVLRDGVEADVPVEDLQVGDQAVTASGACRPIVWIGHRTMECRRHLRPQAVRPVRIGAHAFGENRPARDLVVSPGHAICVDAMGEILVPAAALVDGETIVQLDVARVTYWHVELDAHDILLAENMPAESYLEMGNRGFFAEADAIALHAKPDAPVATHADFCRPFVADGPLVDAVRAQVTARAAGTLVARTRAVA